MKTLTAILSSFAVVASAVSAQPVRKETDVGKQRAAVEAWTACIADERTDRVAAILSQDFTSNEYRGALVELGKARVSKKCFEAMPAAYRKIELGGLPFAGGLAEHMIERDPQPLIRRLSMAALKPEVATYSRTDAIAMCMARGAPHLVAGLFGTAINSAEEGKALAALQPAAKVCGQGVALEASPMGMRSMLATASYRLLAAPGGTAQ